MAFALHHCLEVLAFTTCSIHGMFDLSVPVSTEACATGQTCPHRPAGNLGAPLLLQAQACETHWPLCRQWWLQIDAAGHPQGYMQY